MALALHFLALTSPSVHLGTQRGVHISPTRPQARDASVAGHGSSLCHTVGHCCWGPVVCARVHRLILAPNTATYRQGGMLYDGVQPPRPYGTLGTPNLSPSSHGGQWAQRAALCRPLHDVPRPKLVACNGFHRQQQLGVGWGEEEGA